MRLSHTRDQQIYFYKLHKIILGGRGFESSPPHLGGNFRVSEALCVLKAFI
jgi:hypothetical protein